MVRGLILFIIICLTCLSCDWTQPPPQYLRDDTEEADDDEEEEQETGTVIIQL